MYFISNSIFNNSIIIFKNSQNFFLIFIHLIQSHAAKIYLRKTGKKMNANNTHLKSLNVKR